jgi:predicted nucleic acid-binding protein
MAPDIALIEVGNALRKKVERTEISRDQARAGLEKLTRIFDVLAPTAPLVSRALDLALDMRHPVYDCVYIACAEQTRATLVTDDRRLVSKVRSAGLTIMVQPLSGSDPIVTQ